MYTWRTVQFYDASAETYFKDWRDNALLLPFLQILLNRLREHPKILDLGCGPGCESKRLFDLGATVVGIDLSEVSLSIARRHAPEVSFLPMDIEHLDFADGSFDAVLDAACLFHFSDAEQSRILSTIHTLLVPGGAFLSVYPTGTFRGMQRREIEGTSCERYVNLKSGDDWTRMVCSPGFVSEPLDQHLVGSFHATLFIRQSS
jgi:SAM-dependent methyltransferase